MLLGIKRIYEKASITDGKRIFVDRLWPRGVKKSTANVDLWLKDVAPSDELRKWFAHDPKKWKEFESRYTKELEHNPAVQQLLDIVRNSDITLLYSTEDKEHNNAIVLADFIKKAA